MGTILNSQQTSNEIAQEQQRHCCETEEEYNDECGCNNDIYPPRNQLFDKTNVIKYSMPAPLDAISFFEQIAPKRQSWFDRIVNQQNVRSGAIGVDVTVEFRDAKSGAV